MAMAAALTHPAGETEKVYRVKVRGLVTAEALQRLQTGVVLEDGFAQATNVRECGAGDRRRNRIRGLN